MSKKKKTAPSPAPEPMPAAELLATLAKLRLCQVDAMREGRPEAQARVERLIADLERERTERGIE